MADHLFRRSLELEIDDDRLNLLGPRRLRRLIFVVSFDYRLLEGG
jgi:hypothetical protein